MMRGHLTAMKFNPFDDFSSGWYSAYIPSSRNFDDDSTFAKHSCAGYVDVEVPQQSRQQSPGSYRETIADEANLFHCLDAQGDEEPIMEPGLEGDEMSLFNDEPDNLDEPISSDNADTDQLSVPRHWAAEGSNSSMVSFYDVSSHFTTVDYEAFNVNEFSEFPELNQFIQLKNGQLAKGIVFEETKTHCHCDKALQYSQLSCVQSPQN
ncbi:hypothetical protein GQ457_15G012830 [Hibiscus cannabinus]